ncbi:MAG: hypothetical protein OCD02_04420 [Spirochaetaceae bacterium]
MKEGNVVWKNHPAGDEYCLLKVNNEESYVTYTEGLDELKASFTKIDD